jgi:hypothetical protein
MGRPIKKSFFGALNQTGFQISVTADLGGGAVPAWILNQRGTRKYTCTDGTDTMVCTLISAPGSLVAGTAVLPVTTTSGVEYARTLLQHTVKTFSNNVYNWESDGRGEVVVGVGISPDDVPVQVTAAEVSDYTVTGLEVLPLDISGNITVAGSGYVDGVSYADAVVTGYTGITAPTVSYDVVGGEVTVVEITAMGTAVAADVLAIAIPAPAP